MLRKITVLVLLAFVGVVVAKSPEPPGHCPRIHAAVQALDTAIEEMNKAGHDFCGHKAEALEKARQAREQLHLAEGCDKCK